MTTQRSALVLLIVSAACITWSAAANDATASRPSPGPTPPLEVTCRVFARPLDPDTPLDTHDATTEIGRWVIAQAAEGWVLRDVQLVLGTKATGYPQAWSNVCLERAWSG